MPQAPDPADQYEEFQRFYAEVAADIEKGILTFTGLTNATPAPPPLTGANFEAMRRQFERLRAEYKRSLVTIIVDAGHTGPMQLTDHPTDGKFVECSYDQAREVNREVPLRLVRVLSVDRAEFQRATVFDGVFCPLIPPPYEIPEGE